MCVCVCVCVCVHVFGVGCCDINSLQPSGVQLLLQCIKFWCMTETCADGTGMASLESLLLMVVVVWTGAGWCVCSGT